MSIIAYSKSVVEANRNVLRFNARLARLEPQLGNGFAGCPTTDAGTLAVTLLQWRRRSPAKRWICLAGVRVCGGGTSAARPIAFRCRRACVALAVLLFGTTSTLAGKSAVRREQQPGFCTSRIRTVNTLFLRRRTF